MRLLLDTSVFIAEESGRPLGSLPGDADLAVSVVTLAELRLGLLVSGADVRARRLATYERAAEFEALPIDRSVAEQFAELAAAAVAAGRKIKVQDTWVAATALANDAGVVTQDDDFAAFGGLSVVAV